MSEISVGTTLTTAFNVTGDLTGSLVVKTGSSATTALTLSATGNLSLATGNLTFSGTGQRITGDFSNATASNRLLFQTSTTNGNSFVGNMPNGTGSYGAYISYNGSDPANSSSFLQGITSTDARLVSTAAGTGSLLPLTFYTGGSERMRITSGGEVYIAGTTDQGAYNLQVNGTGVWGAGAYVNGSDERLKDDITSLDSGLDVVAAMRPVTFRYKPEHSKDQSVQPGFIAQELQQAMTGKDYLDGVVQSGPEYLNVAYQNIIPILVKAMQEQQEQIKALQDKIAALEAK